MPIAISVSKKSCTFALMFERLQSKWNVSGPQLFLVLCVFAIGGSATGYFGKIIMTWLSIERGWLWTLIYILIVTLIWPITVLAVSILFGQFAFFSQYLRRLGSRIGILKKTNHSSQVIQTTSSESSGRNQQTNIAIFASGTGTNAKKLIDYFRNHPRIKVALIACNKPGAGVLTIGALEKIPCLIIEKEKFFRGNAYIDELRDSGIHFIVLAGFLWKIPQRLIDVYRNRIINIHPALLPKYGGKGMYGSRVHEAVINNGDKESGVTIHYVDEQYDNGDIIFQVKVNVMDSETPDSLAAKIHVLEHNNYPRVIEELILQPNGR